MPDTHTPAPDPLTRPVTWTDTPTRTMVVAGERLAWRDLGPLQGTPVLLLTHLGATLDEWDPRIVDALARDHRVITVDLPGVGASTGTVPLDIATMAATARAVIEALNLDQVDVVGFSMGGFIAQQLALDAPHLVRRLVLTGTGPAGGKGIAHLTGGAYVYWDMLRAAIARTDAKEYLFFPRTAEGRAAARDYLARIHERTTDRDTSIAFAAFHRQIRAISRWGRQPAQDLSHITAPTLIANGDHDRMVPSNLSHDLHHRIPGSTLVIYPNSGHGGVFQYHRDFIPALLNHLNH